MLFTNATTALVFVRFAPNRSRAVESRVIAQTVSRNRSCSPRVISRGLKLTHRVIHTSEWTPYPSCVVAAAVRWERLSGVSARGQRQSSRSDAGYFYGARPRAPLSYTQIPLAPSLTRSSTPPERLVLPEFGQFPSVCSARPGRASARRHEGELCPGVALWLSAPPTERIFVLGSCSVTIHSPALYHPIGWR
jgi:hypothetical protein